MAVKDIIRSVQYFGEISSELWVEGYQYYCKGIPSVLWRILSIVEGITSTVEVRPKMLVVPLYSTEYPPQ